MSVMNNTAVNAAGHLTIGGCDTVELAAQYGTPLCDGRNHHPSGAAGL